MKPLIPSNEISSTDFQMAACLIKEELKSRKLANLLEEINVKDCPPLPALNEPIAALLNLNSDESFLLYDRIMETHLLYLDNKADSFQHEAQRIIQDVCDSLTSKPFDNK